MDVIFNVAGHERSCLTRQVMNVLSNFAFPEWPPSGGLGFAARFVIALNLNTPASILLLSKVLKLMVESVMF